MSSAACPMNGRNTMALMSLAPGVALAHGQLGGYVFDATGAAIPNAHLQIQNLATGASWSAISTADGSWRIIGLPSGTYQVTATAPGFQNTVLNISVRCRKSSCLPPGPERRRDQQ